MTDLERTLLRLYDAKRFGRGMMLRPEMVIALFEVLDRNKVTLATGRRLVEEMDAKMPEQALADEDGWIVNYRIPVGPWHRLLGWARGTA